MCQLSESEEFLVEALDNCLSLGLTKTATNILNMVHGTFTKHSEYEQRILKMVCETNN